MNNFFWQLFRLIHDSRTCFYELSFTAKLLHTCYADILLEKGKIKAEEIWDIYKSAPRVAQVDLNST